MWCYQKPGFKVLLLAELQRQQQCSQFCDTLLKAEGVSVPAHSCILSAVSPHISSALSSVPAPPAGQSRLLEFQTLGACTLLHMVRLLYSGEMAGEGEKEKQEAISAAAKLGIHGLVEVTKRKSRNEGGGVQHAEVGVQTEPLMPVESERRQSRWRRDVRDGSTVLWKEILSNGEKDMCTQTDELQVNVPLPTHTAVSLDTIDVTVLQELGLGQTDSQLVPSQIPYIPIPAVYPPDENQIPQPSSAPPAFMQDPTAARYTSVAAVAMPYTSTPPSLLPFTAQLGPCAADPENWWTGTQEAAKNVTAGEEGDERFEMFQDNIAGFISYFLNSDQEHVCTEQGGRQAGARGARRARTGQRHTRRPRATGGRGRGRFTQTVAVQDVGMSRLQKLFLKKERVRTSRAGQGGGAVGRKLYLKTREFLTSAKSCQRTRRRGKVWEFSETGDTLPYSEKGGGGGAKSGRKTRAQQRNQDSLPVGTAQRARARPATPVSFSPFPMQLYNGVSASSPSLQPPPSASLLSSAASYVSPTSSLLHTTSHSPPSEDQFEHIDHLLEEVMMGLHILPNGNSSGTKCAQPPIPTSSSRCTCASSGTNLAQNKQQDHTTGFLEAGPGVHGSTQVVNIAGGTCDSNSIASEVPVLQQHQEGELNDMLNNFLQLFEQHINSCSAREDEQMDDESSSVASQPYSDLSKYRKTTTTPTPPLQNKHSRQPVGCPRTTALQQSGAAAHSTHPPKHTKGTTSKARAPVRRGRTSQLMFSLGREVVRGRKSVSSNDAKTKIPHEQKDKQLQQVPVVILERSLVLGHCQSHDVKSPAKTKTSSASVKCSQDRSSKKNQSVWWSTKTYPIRSRLGEAKDSTTFLKEPRAPSTGQPGVRKSRPKKNGQLPSSSNGESSSLPIQPQFVDPCGMEEQLENDQERQEEELTVQPQEEADGPTRRGKRTTVESEETSDDATVVKRVCFEQVAQPATETPLPSFESADCEAGTVETEDVIDVETVSLTGVGHCLQRDEQEENPVWSKSTVSQSEESLLDEETESSNAEFIEVDEDSDGINDLEKDTGDCHEWVEKDRDQGGAAPVMSQFVSPPLHFAEQASLGSAVSREDEDIDVIGGSSPAPEPVFISWTESSEGEKDTGDCHEWVEKDRDQGGAAPVMSQFVSPPLHFAEQASLGSAVSREDEDINVIGGSSPAPEPVFISWTESSEGEEEDEDEDIDVEEKTHCASSVLCAAASEGELVNRNHLTNMLSR
uniref:uncharacterized protein LOC109957127 isoform X2 n=1 Tax=Monopterus albus TaxID=43700 RepID=UPI0009B45104|nr:uncharacterized protein LOC109957127 isoform X2 [Monopterus albus]